MTSDRSACPSARSSAGSQDGSADSVGLSTGFPLRISATSCSRPAAHTVKPGTSEASSCCPVGTMAWSNPALAAASSAGSTPRTRRTRPSRLSSPSSTVRDSSPGRTPPSAAMAATAMATS